MVTQQYLNFDRVQKESLGSDHLELRVDLEETGCGNSHSGRPFLDLFQSGHKKGWRFIHHHRRCVGQELG